MPLLVGADVVERQVVTNDLWRLRLKPKKNFSFRPGQYCVLNVNGLERPYYIASSPGEEPIELLIRLHPHGQVTPILHRLTPGATVSMRAHASGVLTLEMSATRHFMAATTTGIAPFVSILRTYLGSRRRSSRFFVLYVARYQDEFAYKDVLTALAKAYPHAVELIFAVSRPNDVRNLGWSGASGRLDAVVDEYVAPFLALRHETLVYACGNPVAVEALRARLSLRGLRLKEDGGALNT